MKDNIEQFISKNKKEFDSESPPDMVWMNLEKQLEKRRTSAKVIGFRSSSLVSVFKIAAMFVVVLGVGLLIGLQINNNQGFSSPSLQEFAEAEQHYSKEVDNLWSVVKASSLEEESTIQEDLNALDAVYNELKAELLDNPTANTEVAVNAMLNNYKAKIEILETVLGKYKTDNTNQLLNIENDKVEI